MKKLIYIIVMIVCASLWSCRSVKYVDRPVEVEKTQTIYKVLAKHDSIDVRDSVFIYLKGDTVYNTHFSTKYKYLAVHDTILQKDTVPQIVTITELKETNVLKSWQKTLMWWGGILTVLVVLYIGFKLRKFI